jgi:hypothetical protein
MLTSHPRSEQGFALVTTVILTAVMLILGTAILGLVVTQSGQTSTERGGESAFNLAEATLNAEAFLLGRNWPKTGSPTTSCDASTLVGTLATPASTATAAQQVQSLLAQTYTGSGNPTSSQWHVTACAEGGRDSWDASLLNGLAYDANADSGSGPRRMWVRAEATVDGEKRAVVGLVQAGKQPVFPSNLAVTAGKMGGNLTTTSGQVLTGNVVGPLLTTLTGGSSGKMIDGNIGLRCSILDVTSLGVTNCLSGIFKATSMTTVAPLLQANNFVDFRSDQTISTEQVALLRQQAKSTGTYYPNLSSVAGGGGVANGASCIPATGAAGKVVFIEQVGDGTGHCIVNTASASSTAAAIVVGSGGVRVCSNATCATASSGGTYTGVIYALHKTAPLQNSWADVRIEGGSKVVGGVFTDDNASVATTYQHGFVEVVPPAIDMTAVLNSITSTLPLCQVPLVGAITCKLTTLLGGTLDSLLSTLGISPATLAASMITQLNPSLPAITYSSSAVSAITTMGDSALVPGTFREVAPKF